jgi:hypothetical protein
MTWELLVIFVLIGVAVGGIWAYTRRNRTPYGRSLSQEVRDRVDSPNRNE